MAKKRKKERNNKIIFMENLEVFSGDEVEQVEVVSSNDKVKGCNLYIGKDNAEWVEG